MSQNAGENPFGNATDGCPPPRSLTVNYIHMANVLDSRTRVISVSPLGDPQFISTASRSRQNSQHNTHSLERRLCFEDWDGFADQL